MEEVLSGENRELQLLVAQGLFPLPPEELLSLQVALAGNPDEEIAEAARRSLVEVGPKIASTVLAAAETPTEVVSYFASRPSHPVILETILRKRNVATEILEEVAENLPADLQEILLLRQDAILQHPEILDRLEKNPELSPFASRRIQEYREHLLPRMAEEAPVETAPIDEEEASDDEVVEAVLEARSTPAEGQEDESTGLSDAQIRSLPIPVRLKLTRGASRTLRNILIKDNNPMVAKAVIYGNAMADSEVEQIINSRAVWRKCWR